MRFRSLSYILSPVSASSADETMDVSVHDVDSNGTVKELHRASGGPWGLSSVSDIFIAWLTQLLGEDVMKSFKNERMEDYYELSQNIAMRLSKFSSAKNENKYFNIRIEPALSTKLERVKLTDDIKYTAGVLRISSQLVESWIKEPISNAIRHISGILTEPAMSGVDTILLVGRFAECPLIQEAVKKAFSNKKIVIPTNPTTAVLCGAVLFGRQFTTM